MRAASRALFSLATIALTGSCKKAVRESAAWRQEVAQVRQAVMVLGEDVTNSFPGGWMNKIIADISKGEGPEAQAAYQALENIQRAYKGNRTAVQGEWSLRIEPLKGLRPNESPLVAVFPLETDRQVDFRAAVDKRGMLQFDQTEKGRIRATSRPRVADDVWRDVDTHLREYTRRISGNASRTGGGYGSLRVVPVFDSLAKWWNGMDSFGKSRDNLDARINRALDTLSAPLRSAVRALYDDQPLPVRGQPHREVNWDLNGPEQYAWILFRKEEFERAFDADFQLQVSVRLIRRPDSVFAGGPAGSKTGITLGMNSFCTRQPGGACELQTVETEREGTLVYGVAYVGPKSPLTEAWLQRRSKLTELRQRYEAHLRNGDQDAADSTFREFMREVGVRSTDISVNPPR